MIFIDWQRNRPDSPQLGNLGLVHANPVDCNHNFALFTLVVKKSLPIQCQMIKINAKNKVKQIKKKIEIILHFKEVLIKCSFCIFI